jgi:poly-beta-1,6-N-acetyl-D-glucosamine synthase
MMIVFYTAVGLLFAYGILFQFYGSWWKQVPAFTANHAAPAVRISVIVPARNEAAHIEACIKSICLQDYPKNLYQLIVIDDNSDDNTFSLASSIACEGLQIICHRLPSVDNNTAPKKRAIETAIGMASGQLVVTTDADCIVPAGWLSTLVNYYQQSGNVFIAAPVKITDAKSILSKFQALDFLTMQGITAAAVFKRFHNMCNGANLAYERAVFHAVDGFKGIDNIASGDDMLLMNKIAAQYPGRLGYCKAGGAIVSTQAAAGWKAFFQQRIRWASKATHHEQRGIFMVLLLVYCTNLLIFSFLLMGCWNRFALLLFLLLCIAKFFMELFFVKEVAHFFRQQYLVPWLLLLQPLHIIYIVASGLLGQFTSYEWKGRKLK